jgi:beta-glucosidase
MTGTRGDAAAYSQRDAHKNGVGIGRDARALGVDVVLEPFVNIDRDPAWARAFNTFGEDPLLTGQTGAGEISGIQSQGTMAMVKHFIAYDGGNNVVVDSQTLHEIYLEPFADAINAGVASIMCPITPCPGGGGHLRQERDARTILLRQQPDLTGPRGELGFRGSSRPTGAPTRHQLANDGRTWRCRRVRRRPADGPPPTRAALSRRHGQRSPIDAAVGRILYEWTRFGCCPATPSTTSPRSRSAPTAGKVVATPGRRTLLQGDALRRRCRTLISATWR